jgi:autoinducer 2-degrading protein
MKMFVLYVSIQTKPEFAEEFKKACVENAQNSVKEAGNVRFDVLQQSDEPSRFVLIEAYLNDGALEKHRQTAHYNKWRQKVEKMLVGERIKTVFTPVWPEKY